MYGRVMEMIGGVDFAGGFQVERWGGRKLGAR